MWRDERGMALLLVLMCAMLFLALGGALVTVVSSEAAISATFRESAVALSAADAAIVRVLSDLATARDLNAILAGAVASSFTDGPPQPLRPLPDGMSLDLVAATNVERCGQTACADAQMDAVTLERPWGANNARWQTYGSGWLRDLTPQARDVPYVYVVVWIGDDPLETDGNPLTDDPDENAPGHDVVLLRAVAYAAYSARRTIEVVARRDGGTVGITSWREIH